MDTVYINKEKDIKSMAQLHNKYIDDVIELIENSDDVLKMIVSLQLDLMNKIIKTKQLENMSIIELQKNMVISIIDEINETKEWCLPVNMYSVNGIDAELEARYEIIDALHFVLQLYILGYMYYKNIKLTDLDDELVRKEVVEYVTEYIKTIKTTKILDSIYISDDIFEMFESITTTISELLKTMHWKHWKTYNKENFDISRHFYILNLMYIQLFEIFTYFLNGSEQEWYAYYIVKNIENIDRQNRGY